MLFRENLSLKIFRLIFLPLLSTFELILIILFLLMPFYAKETADVIIGYSIFFGWFFSLLSFLVFLGLLLLFLSTFNYRKLVLKSFFHKDNKIKILANFVFFFLYSQIIFLAITQSFYAPFINGLSILYLLILILSLALPMIIYFLSNFEIEPKQVYGFSKAAPLSIKATTFWMLFLSGASQLFSIVWEIAIVGLILLLTAYLFFYLYRYSITIIPLVLIIHFTFSIIMAVISFIFMNEIIIELTKMNFSITSQIYIILSIVILLIPGFISILLAQSLFHKKLIAWFKSARPEPEMEIKLNAEE